MYRIGIPRAAAGRRGGARLIPAGLGLALAMLAGAIAWPAGLAKVVVYSPHGPEILAEMEQRFEAAHPEIDMIQQYLSQTDILAKLRVEQDNPYCDVWWGGTTEFFNQAAREGLLRPYSPTWAGAVGEDCHHPDNLWHGQFLQIPCFLYNTLAMKAEDAPRDWDELLEPKWKSRIVIREPLMSGTMKTIYSAMIQRQIDAGGTEDDGFEWLRRLERQTSAYLPTPEAMFDKVARSPAGYVSLWNVTDAMYQSQSKGYPVGFVTPPSGPVSVDALAIVKSSPNPDLAEQFYEYCSNVESSIWLAERHYRFNARSDLPPEAQPAWQRAVECKPMRIDWDAFNSKVGPWMERWRSEIRDPGK